MVQFLRDLWGFLSHRKKFWLLPIIIVLLAFGIITVLGATGLGPFIYSLF
jgi:hypothetical protein